MRILLYLILILLLASCAVAPPSADVFKSANRAIEGAERAGAEELSPVELRFSREKLNLAKRLVENGKNKEAFWAIEQSEINAELAIEQSRTALERRKVNELQRANEVLSEELQSTYGEAFE
jgi:hypothetical protein